MIAIGQTLTVLTAGVDLACGRMMGLGRTVMTKFAADFGLPAPLAIHRGIAVTALFGLLNGLLVIRIKRPPCSVTLGTLHIALAVTPLDSNAPGGDRCAARHGLAGQHLFHRRQRGGCWRGADDCPVPGGVVLAACNRTWPPRPRGGQQPASDTADRHPTERVRLGVSVLAGVFCGMANLRSAARTGVADPTAGQTEHLDAIAAMVLGGTSLFGGRGVVLGTLVGALAVGALRNGLALMGVASVYPLLISGILVILAVAIDQLCRKGARQTATQAP